MSARVFISHSTVNDDFINQLQRKLEAHGVKAWIDSRELTAGDKLDEEIEQAIKQSDYLIAVLCFDALASEWVEKEIKYATHCGLRVIPILYGDLTVKHARHILGKDRICLNIASSKRLRTNVNFLYCRY